MTEAYSSTSCIVFLLAVFWVLENNRAPITGLRRTVCRFIMKPMKLKVKGPSFAEAPSTALGGAPAMWPHGHTVPLHLQELHLGIFSFCLTHTGSKPHKAQNHC